MKEFLVKKLIRDHKLQSKINWLMGFNSSWCLHNILKNNKRPLYKNQELITKYINKLLNTNFTITNIFTLVTDEEYNNLLINDLKNKSL